jgi:predicted DNA-binding transcriptional regulator AlpA
MSMKTCSTREAAKRLGLHPTTLADYVAEGKVPTPTVLKVGTASLHAWTEAEIEHVRQLLPKIANGRKTRWEKERQKQKAQARAPRPRQAKRLSGAPMPVPPKKKTAKKKK